MASFDIVSEINTQELDNAINQARKQIDTRYDFKGSKCEIKWDRKNITILADNDYQLNAMKDILQGRAHHRGIDIRSLKFEEAAKATGNTWRQPVNIVAGIDNEQAKKIIKLIKDSRLKVQVSMQEDKVRVNSKSIDSLQECMSLLKNASLEIPVQFENMR